MNILTIDIEEWFHLLDNDSTKTANEWKNFESRIHRNMERVFDLLERYSQMATFFCLGWVAETYPEVIKETSKRGYEIGTHTRMHQLVYEQSRNAFSRDLEYSVKTLEDLTGQKVKYFRAPGFSIREDSKWAFEVLMEQGIEVDCSVFPAPRSHGGLPTYKQPVPSVIRFSGKSGIHSGKAVADILPESVCIKELPINYVTLLGKPVIFSGGGYFRLIPYPLMKFWTKQSAYVMTYFHPRDFDADQPMIEGLPLSRRFKSYVGLKGAEKKLEKWITDFEFVDVGTAIEKIDWEAVPVVEL